MKNTRAYCPPIAGAIAYLGIFLGMSGCLGVLSQKDLCNTEAPCAYYNIRVITDNHETTIPSGSVVPVRIGASQVFEINPNPGYSVSAVTGCGGTLNGTAYSIQSLHENCELRISTSVHHHTINAPAIDSGIASVSPATSKTVDYGTTQSYTFAMNGGVSTNPRVLGTCPQGTWSNGNLTYTTGGITSDCSLSFSSGFPVTLISDGHETLSPASSTVYVSSGATQAVLATPSNGYSLTVGGTCAAGSWNVATYTTGTINSACTLSFTGALAPAVDLTSQFNFIGIADDGVPFGGGSGSTQGFDHDGNSFSSLYIPASFTTDGVSFTMGAAGVFDMFNSNTGLTLNLPSSVHYSKIKMIAASVNAALIGKTGTFVVHYTDSSTTSITQTFSDWAYPYPNAPGSTLAQNPGNQKVVISSPYRDTYTGGRETAASIPVLGFYAFEYTFTVDSSKYLSTLQTPANQDIQIMAITAVP